MSVIAKIRRHQRPRARSVFGVLMLVWLNIVVQPCVLAAPAANMADVGAVHVHDARIVGDDSKRELDGKCPRCFDCGHDGCGELAFCDGPVVASAKSGQKVVDSDFSGLVAIHASWFAAAYPSASMDQSTITSIEPPLPTVSLSVRNCVYLK